MKIEMQEMALSALAGIGFLSVFWLIVFASKWFFTHLSWNW